MKTGKLLVVEGVDGVGKTSLAKKLESRGFTYFSTPQSPFSSIRKEVEELRDFQARFFYYLASVVAVQPTMRKMMAEGKNLVVDRYIYSTLAMHKALGVDTGSVNADKLPIIKPDVGILLTADRGVRQIRRLGRPGNNQAVDYYLEQTEDLLDQAQEAFKEFSELTIIDTNSLNENQVLGAIIDILKERSKQHAQVT